MKYVAAIVLFGLSLLLGLAAAVNVYFIVATMDSSHIRAVTTSSYIMTGALALIAVISLVGGVAILSRRDGKS
jgi:hypothetical protein